MAPPPGFAVRAPIGGQVSDDPPARGGFFPGIGFDPAPLAGRAGRRPVRRGVFRIGTALALEKVGYRDFQRTNAHHREKPTMSKNAERSIMLVDDEENICRSLRRTLKQEGYHVAVASEPAEALELLQQSRVDMVISDHLMPNMTGLELLKIVRNRYPDCVRIMLTGHADMQTAIKAINQGEIYRFLTKPWDNTELKVTIHLAFEELDLARENRRILAAARRQYDLLQLSEHPGISNVVRDSTGAILIEDDVAVSPPEVS